MRLPNDVSTIIEVLEQAGYEAYAVGGCVRDSLLNEEPKDYDITTSATPSEVKALFRRTIDTGIEHGTVTVRMSGVSYEVTTYRIDGEYEDFRHPKEVKFTGSLEEDLKRRDFTINAMAYNEKTGLVDLYGGEEDLKNRLIRCVGDPVQRFTEDALRMLRAVRFAAKLSFTIEDETFKAMKALHENLAHVSAERIYVELSKTLMSDNPEMIEDAYGAGLTGIFMPELDAFFAGDKAEEVLRNLKKSDMNLQVRLAILLENVNTKDDEEAGDMAYDVLRRLKTDRFTFEMVKKLVALRTFILRDDRYEVRKFLARYGRELTEYYIKVLSVKGEKENEIAKKLKATVDAIYDANECVTVKDMALSGTDLIEMGFEKGTVIGDKLNLLFEAVLKDPSLNNREDLIRIAKQE
ncbi:MAG: CCA tRNA nucleotidyltransferase [Lachnospiraceae bacterium]|nr:CCA tRNA nucleotidyltransferase [Lachnospiraceae bacterium]